jgi:hypothetical protein
VVGPLSGRLAETAAPRGGTVADGKPTDDEDKDDTPTDDGKHNVGDDKQTGTGPGDVNPSDDET